MDLPVGNKIIPVETPLHVYQLMMHLLKETFRVKGDKDYPFRYTDDFNTTGLVIDQTYNKDSQVYGAKPAIICSRGDMSSQPAILGDVVKQTIGGNSITWQKTGMVGSSVVIKTISKHSAEVDIIANEVFNFLMSCRSELPHLVNIMNIYSVTTSPISQYEADDHLYYCVSTMNYVMQYVWTHNKPLAEMDLWVFVNDRRIKSVN